MRLIKTNIRKEYEFYKANAVRVVHSGDLAALPIDIRQEIEAVEADTEDFSGITVNLAINYGGRNEIIRAVRGALAAGSDPADLGEHTLGAYLDQPEIPDLDLIIRTGGSSGSATSCYGEAAMPNCTFPPPYGRISMRRS